MGAFRDKATRILIIDDDEKFCRPQAKYWASFGFDLAEAHDGMTGVQQLSESKFDAVILDLLPPGMDAKDVLRRLGPHRRVPVLILTARGDEPNRIAGLETGADDYQAKAASPREIVAHLRALTRGYKRMERYPSARVRIGELYLGEESRIATLRSKALRLTDTEFNLLLTLARSAGRIRTRVQLLQEIADRHSSAFDRAIDVHISSLRHKLGDDPLNPGLS